MIILHGIQFLVEFYFFRGLANVIVRNEKFQIGIHGTVGDKLHIFRRMLRNILPLGIDFYESLVEYPLICLESHVGDKTALLPSKQVSGSSYVQILHRDVESASKFAESLYGLDPALGVFRYRCHRRHYQVAVSLYGGTSNPSP